MFRLFDLIARHWPVPVPRKGVLVVRMDGIGDMVLFRRALDHYAEAFGVDKSDITVLGCKSWRSIAGELFAGYRVEVIDEHAFARQPLYRFMVGLRVRRLAPAVAVCDSYLRRTMMADSLVWIAAPSRTVVSLPYMNDAVRAEFTFYLSDADEIIDTGDYPTHEVVRHYVFLSRLTGRALAPEAPRIDWPRDGDGTALVEAGPPYAVLNPGSNEYGRRWPFTEYVRLARHLLETGLRVVFVGVDAEKGVGDLADLAGDGRVIDLAGRTSLPELLDVMAGAALVVSNDTGPAHLAIALGRPTVVIVGGGHFGSFVPYPAEITPSTARFVFKEMPCYHCFWRCHLRDSRFDAFPCVSGVAFEQVRDAAEAVLAVDASA